MAKATHTLKPNGDKDALLANVALLYYGQGLTQSEIATRMQVSRATIVNMLRETREKGIVDIRVNGKHLSTSSLARDLKQKFGLSDVYVAMTETRDNSSDDASQLAQVAQVGAAAFLDIVSPGNRVGVAWGETIMALANVMPKSEVDDVEVCQLIGSMISDRVTASENSAIQIAGKLGAACFTLHAPAIVATKEMAEIFRTEATIKAQLERLQSLDMTVVSIGDTSDDTHFVAAGMATVAEVTAARKAGAVGIICCRYIDADGNGLQMPPNDRLVGTELAPLRRAAKRLLVVSGIERTEATRAAIKGGLATHLCLDQKLAKALLEKAE